MADAIISFLPMFTPTSLALVVLLTGGACASAQESNLDPAQAGLLAEAREVAMRYSASLPDFICTQVVHRTEDPLGNARWRSLDKLTVKLSYFEHKEDYKLLAIDGRPTVKEYLEVGGALSTGEFGTRLFAVFDPRSHADFRWMGWTTLRKRRAARFSFRIAQEHSTFQIQFVEGTAGPKSLVVPYFGEVLVDEETHMTLRLTEHADIPKGFPINGNDSTVDYDFAEVGGRQYLLPAEAHAQTRSGRFVASNTIQFRDYRKFQSEATISFDPPPDKKM